MPQRGGPEQPDGEGRRIQELETLYAVSAAMNQALSEEQALVHALGRVLEVLALESGRIYLINERTKQPQLAATQGNPLFLDPPEAAINSGECLCGLALEAGQPLVSIDAGNDPRIRRLACRQHSRHACAAVPLLVKDRMLGVLHVTARLERPLTSADMALLRSVGAQIGVAVENMRLREQARQTEALSAIIAEMHHRIKNNLQTVADLLSLEMLSTPSPEARKSLRDSVNRIKSIAAVHQLLSSEQLRLTDITELARQVLDISLSHLVRPDQHIQAKVSGPAIFLPSKQATALALVINELLANAIEHGFAAGGAGSLVITLELEGSQISVTIVDDGVGLPPGFDLERTVGLGLQIVRTLVAKDLAGTLSLDSLPGHGCRAQLTFYR